MKNETTRRDFLGTSLGAALALLASRGFNVTGVRAQDGGSSIVISGLTSSDSDDVFASHIHGFQATLNLLTGQFTGSTNSTLATGKQEVRNHSHAINDSVDPSDFDAVVETSATPVHTHLVRPN